LYVFKKAIQKAIEEEKFKLGVTKMTIDIDPFLEMTMVMVSFYEPTCFKYVEIENEGVSASVETEYQVSRIKPWDNTSVSLRYQCYIILVNKGVSHSISHAYIFSFLFRPSYVAHLYWSIFF